MADGLNHVADLAFEAGIKNHFHPTGGEAFDRDGAGLSDFGKDSFLKLGENGVFEGVLGRDLIKFLDPMAGMGKGLAQFAVVAENEETFGIEVKSSHVGEMVESRREKFVDRGAIVFVATGTDEARWFVEDDGLDLEGLDSFPLSADEISWLHPVAGIKAGLAIDDDFALQDKCIAGTTGSDSRGGEVFIEADAFGRFHEKKKDGAKEMAPPENLTEKFSRWGLTLGFGLREANGALTIFPFATLFHEFDSLEALHYRAFTSCAAFTFERVVLGHKIRNGLRARKLGRTHGFGKDEVRVNFTSRRDIIGFLGPMIAAWIF